MMKCELLDDLLCPRGTASLDQDKIAGRRDLAQKLNGLRRRSYYGTVLQTAVCGGFCDRRGDTSNCNHAINAEGSRDLTDFSMTLI